MTDVIYFMEMFRNNLIASKDDFCLDYEFKNKQGVKTNVLRLCRIKGVPGVYLGVPGSTDKPNILFKFNTSPSRTMKLNGELVTNGHDMALAWIKGSLDTLTAIHNSWILETKDQRGSTDTITTPTTTTSKPEKKEPDDIFDFDIPF